MKSLRRILTATALATSLALGGCGTLAQAGLSVGQSLSTSTQIQVRTLAAALSAAKLATDAVDLYVQLGNPDRATLLQLQSLNEGVHTALVNLQAANMRGESLTFAAFNEALAAFKAYAATKGVAS